MIEISEEFLAGVLGTSAEQISSAIKDGDTFKSGEEIQSFLKKSFDDRIYSIKKQEREQQYSFGRKEALQAKERELNEKYGLTGSIEEMITQLLEKGKNKPEATPEDIRNTEIYKADVEALKKQVREAKDQADKAEAEYRGKVVDMKIRQLGSGLLERNNFVMPDVADKSAWEDLLYSRLRSGDVSIDLNGDEIVVKKDGKPLEDDRMNPVKFEDYFVKTAKTLFKVAESDDRQSPNTPPRAPSAPGTGGGGVPKTEAEFMAGVANATGADAKREYIQKYGQKFGVES